MTTGILANNRAGRREMDKVQFESKEAGPSRRPRQTSSITTSVKADSEYGDSPSPIMETQFRSQGEDSDDQLWEADCILDERGETAKGEYLVKWVGFDPKTGENWEPTWERRDGVTPLLAKEWKARKKADPGIIGVEGKKLQVEMKRKKEEERKKRREARLAKTKKGRKKLNVTSEVVDITESRSPTIDDKTHVPGRKTKRSSTVGTTEKDTPIKKSKKSEASTSTSSSMNVPVVELPLRPRTSAVAFETGQEGMEDPVEGIMPLDDTGDRLMRLYTNGDDFEDDEDPPEAPQDAAVEVELEEAAVPPPAKNKRSAPASSPPVDQPNTGRQKRVRIDPAAAAMESPSAETRTPAKAVAQGKPIPGNTLEPKSIGSKDKEAAVKASTTGTAERHANIQYLAPVLLPTDSQFRALLPSTNDSSQSTTSTGPEQSQSDPIQQFISPDRVSHNKPVIAANAAGPSKLAKGVHTLFVDGEEVFGVDTDSGSEGELDPEPENPQDVAFDADVVDDILASFETSPVVAEGSVPLRAPEEVTESHSLKPEVLIEETVAVSNADEELTDASAAIVKSIIGNGVPQPVVASGAVNGPDSTPVLSNVTLESPGNSGSKTATPQNAQRDAADLPRLPSAAANTGQASTKSTANGAPSTRAKSAEDWNLHLSPTLSTKAKTSQDLKISALQQMVAELLMEKSGGWQGKGKPLEASMADSTRVRGLAAEMAKHFRITMDKVKSSADSTISPSTRDIEPRTDTIARTSNVGLQTDSTLVRTGSVGLQTDLIPDPTPAAVTSTTSQTNSTPVTDAGTQTDYVPEASMLDQKAFEEQLAAKDADRKKWRIRAKRAEGEVTTLSEDLQFIREQYQEASASAVREVLKSSELEEKMTILQGQLKHGLKQRDLHHAAVKGRQEKQVAILTAQNHILLEQSRRTDDDVRSRAAAYHEVESQRERLEQLLRDAMRKIDNLSDRNDELVSQIEILRAKQMGVLGDYHVKDESDDGDYSYDDELDAESSAASSPASFTTPSPSPFQSPEPTQSTEPTHSTGASGSAVKQSASAFIVPADSLTASQLMPDTQDLLSAEQSLESESNKEKKSLADPPIEGERRNWNPYPSPWVEGTYFENESAIKEHLMHEVDRGFS